MGRADDSLGIAMRRANLVAGVDLLSRDPIPSVREGGIQGAEGMVREAIGRPASGEQGPAVEPQRRSLGNANLR